MRDYAKVEPKMWHGGTMKALRRSPEGVIVAMYLMTSPSSNMLGLFSQPVLYMAHETGLGLEGASKGLLDCVAVGFCSFDEASEFVWVHEMARYQIANEIKASDNRCKGIQKDYDSLPDNPFLGAFFDRYAKAFHLTNRRGSEAPPKPLRSQEQEQEQEQEKGSAELLTDSTPPEPMTDLSVPLVDSTEFRVPVRLLAEWRVAYPAVHVEQELRQMRTWCLANRTKRKTRRGVEAFIVRWLSKAQDNPGRSAQVGAAAATADFLVGAI